MVDLVGFEPTTSCVQGKHSPVELQTHKGGSIIHQAPIGSEFHIITHNELINLTILGIFLS